MATVVCTIEHSAPDVLVNSMSRQFYAPELDVLRFGAFVLVFGRHVTNAIGNLTRRSAASGNSVFDGKATATEIMSPFWGTVQGVAQSLDFGVCLFFFLSSFLITRILLMEHKRTGKVAICNFYVRRCLRIWPLYFFFLVLILTASCYMPFLEVTRYRMWAAALFLSNWAAVLHGWSCMAIQPLWSVSVEEQFYIVWPNFARFGRQAIILASLLIALGSVATLAYYGNRIGSEVTQTWPNTLVQCLFLAGGALTACLSMPERRRTKLSIRLLLISTGFIVWIVASSGFHVVRTRSPGPVLLILGYLLILLGTYFIFSGVVGWNATRIPNSLRYLGKISYGLYVFHSMWLVVCGRVVANTFDGLHVVGLSPYIREGVSALLALTLTLCSAALSYKYLETPFLRLKERFTVVSSRAV